MLQRIARNPLVSPDVIGIGAGVSAGAVVTIVLGAGAVAVGALAVAAGLAVGAPPVLLLTRRLRLLELGDEVARALSGGIGVARAALVASTVGMTALATAAAGPIAFVALVAPQIVRRVLGSRPAGLVPAAETGALVVALADLAARRLFSPYELPAGVLTAAAGAPVLLYLLVRGVSRRTG